MRSEILVNIDGEEFRFDLEEAQPMPHDVARKWLDDQFTAMECEPLRASGKLLIADKVIVVARDAGKAKLADPAWGRAFAAAASAALGKPVIRIDTDNLSVSY